jgi:drug/metabolite transporter (DMT)-like permease
LESAPLDTPSLDPPASQLPAPPQLSTLWAAVLTLCALVAFAGNSVLCRMALGEGAIDWASFSMIRMGSGALTLVLAFQLLGGKGRVTQHGSWRSAAWLTAYAVTFSYAYLSLGAGTGALILFGTVQLTMIGHGVCRGERPGLLEWTGFLIATGGLVYLVLPGITSPDLFGAFLMALAGLGWGAYSLMGKGSTHAAWDTMGNLLRTSLLFSPIFLLALDRAHLSAYGVLLALLSGVLATGMGYMVWYAVLPKLTATRAGILQLTVPLLAAAAGGLLLGETIDLRILIASVTILGGVALSLLSRPR